MITVCIELTGVCPVSRACVVSRRYSITVPLIKMGRGEWVLTTLAPATRLAKSVYAAGLCWEFCPYLCHAWCVTRSYEDLRNCFHNKLLIGGGGIRTEVMTICENTQPKTYPERNTSYLFKKKSQRLWVNLSCPSLSFFLQLVKIFSKLNAICGKMSLSKTNEETLRPFHKKNFPVSQITFSDFLFNSESKYPPTARPPVVVVFFLAQIQKRK